MGAVYNRRHSGESRNPEGPGNGNAPQICALNCPTNGCAHVPNAGILFVPVYLYLWPPLDFELIDSRLGFWGACWVRSPIVDQDFTGFVAHTDRYAGAFSDIGIDHVDRPIKGKRCSRISVDPQLISTHDSGRWRLTFNGIGLF